MDSGYNYYEITSIRCNLSCLLSVIIQGSKCKLIYSISLSIGSVSIEELTQHAGFVTVMVLSITFVTVLAVMGCVLVATCWHFKVSYNTNYYLPFVAKGRVQGFYHK